MAEVQFKNIPIGEKFGCWGDLDLNYDYPKMCVCKKTSSDKAIEIEEEGGVEKSLGSYFFNEVDEVFDLKNNNNGN